MVYYYGQYYHYIGLRPTYIVHSIHKEFVGYLGIEFVNRNFVDHRYYVKTLDEVDSLFNDFMFDIKRKKKVKRIVTKEEQCDRTEENSKKAKIKEKKRKYITGKSVSHVV